MNFLLLCISLILFSSNSFADQKLAFKKNCMACHQAKRKVVGPSYKDIIDKYKDKDKTELEKYLKDKIINGSKGVWGVVPMPNNPKVTEEEAKKLANWIMESN